MNTLPLDLLSPEYIHDPRPMIDRMLLLLGDPEQLARVRADPSLIPGWIEETLRCEPSIGINTRSITAPFTYQGQPGQMIYFIITAANRDPEQFPDPHRFDVARTDNKHLAFGFGAHFVWVLGWRGSRRRSRFSQAARAAAGLAVARAGDRARAQLRAAAGPAAAAAVAIVRSGQRRHSRARSCELQPRLDSHHSYEDSWRVLGSRQPRGFQNHLG